MLCACYFGSMFKTARVVVLVMSTGLVWWWCMQALFIWSGAQQVLSNPAYQSSKFIKVFTEYKPLPRMYADRSIFWKGFVVCGEFAAVAFLIVNNYLRGGWLRRGLVFGILHWCLMVPWFEIYLPYNVMHEPMMLVLFEGLLWLITILLTGLYMSFVVNFKDAR